MFDEHFAAQHQQADQWNTHTEDGDADKAHSEGECEVPAMKTHGAHVQHPVTMLPSILQSNPTMSPLLMLDVQQGLVVSAGCDECWL